MKKSELKEIIKEVLQEVVEPNVGDILKKIESDVSKIFPNGIIRIVNEKGSVNLTFAMIGKKSDQQSGLFENDPAYTRMRFRLPKNKIDTTKFKISHFCCDVQIVKGKNLRINYASRDNTLEKHAENLVTFFKKMGKAILDNKDSINAPDKYFKIRA